VSPGSSSNSADDRDLLRHDLMTPLTVISAQTQLMQRRVLRADGLSDLERERMLTSLASTMKEIQRLTAQLERMLSGDKTPSDEGVRPPDVSS
jgi:signal transduction histidine kinase